MKYQYTEHNWQQLARSVTHIIEKNNVDKNSPEVNIYLQKLMSYVPITEDSSEL